jgi:CYTH domain-containing protein
VAPERVGFLREKPFSRRFDDRYLRCGRMRLRAMTNSDDGLTTYKLTKKYAYEHHAAQPIVSVWLTADEYTALHGLDGDDLSKTRWYDDHAGHRFSIDVFVGPLTGLVLCEVEAPTAEALRMIAAPPYAVVEVSEDPFFTGGQLVGTSSSMLQARLAALGLGPQRR